MRGCSWPHLLATRGVKLRSWPRTLLPRMPGYNVSLLRHSLERLYESTSGANWTNNENWMGAGTDPCNWTGVTCDAFPYPPSGPPSGMVLVELNGNSLAGTLPSEIDVAANLAYLVRTAGPIPARGRPIAATRVVRCSHASSQVLYSNYISGTIPTSLGLVSPTLQTTYLHYNRLSGSLPSQLGQLSRLSAISIFGNRLSGSIPTELAAIPQMRTCIYSVEQFSDQPTPNTNLFRCPLPRFASRQCAEPAVAGRGNLSCTYTPPSPPPSPPPSHPPCSPPPPDTPPSSPPQPPPSPPPPSSPPPPPSPVPPPPLPPPPSPPQPPLSPPPPPPPNEPSSSSTSASSTFRAALGALIGAATIAVFAASLSTYYRSRKRRPTSRPSLRLLATQAAPSHKSDSVTMVRARIRAGPTIWAHATMRANPVRHAACTRCCAHHGAELDV